jgi:hypothetical protein
MKAFGVLFVPIMAVMVGVHVWARAESIPKTVEHKTPAFTVSGTILENWRGDEYNMTITAKKPIWVLASGYREKDRVVRLQPKQTLKLSNQNVPGAISISELNCTVRILADDERFEYRAC